MIKGQKEKEQESPGASEALWKGRSGVKTSQGSFRLLIEK